MISPRAGAPGGALDTVLEGMFRRLLRQPVAVLLVMLALTAAAASQLPKLRIAVDFAGLIGEQTPGAQAIRQHQTRFAPLRAEEVLLVRAPTLADEAALTAFEDLIFALQFIDGVEQVISLASLPAPGREGPWLFGPELAGLAPAERLATMRAANPLAAQLLSEDLSLTLIAVIPAPGQGGGALAESLHRIAAETPEFEIALAGLSAVQRAVGAEILHDLWTLIPAAVAICLLLLLFLFRDLRTLVVIALPPIVGLVWFFGALAATGTAFDPMLASLPVVLIVLAFSDSIHVFHAAQSGVADAAAPAGDGRLARALAQTAPAAALTSLTTILAFGSLAFPDSPSLNTMAWAGGLGMVLELVAVLVLTPALMRLTGCPSPRSRPLRAPAAMMGLARVGARHPRRVLLVTVLLLGGLALLKTQADIGFRYADYLPRDAEVTRALATIEAAGLGSDRLVLVVEADPDAPLERVHAAAGVIWGEAGADWARGDGAVMLTRMAARDGGAHALPLQLPIGADGQRADHAIDQLLQRLDAAGLDGHAHLVGPGHALITEGARLVESLRTGMYVTVLLITALIWAVYRSARLALAALAVNVIPILGVEGFLVLIGREVTMMNMIALTVAFGIAVDDTLHLLNRHRLAQGPGRTRILLALDEAGPPMVATSMILLAGLLVTLASALPGLALYGGLIALAVSLALLADLFLLPGLVAGEKP